MKKTFIIANWKSNKTASEAKSWLAGLKIKDLRLTNKEVIICSSFTSLPILQPLIINHKSSIKLGAQDISSFGEGAYTGEINGKQIKEFADYVIIGHSERRKNFLESDEILFRKAELAKQYGLIPIFCVQDEATKVPRNIEIVVYEPVFAIGTGNPDTPENAERVAMQIKANKKALLVLYGGSVTSKNIKRLTQMPNIDGALVGGASLDAAEFYAIIQNA